MAALNAAKARFNDDPEGAFAEQTRLRDRLSNLDDRLKNFGRKKAAIAADTEISREAVDEPLSDLETD
jgi:DNA primase